MNFEAFYDALSDEGYCIYPGKEIPGGVKFFRIGNIGEIGAKQCTELVEAAGRIFGKQ